MGLLDGKAVVITGAGRGLGRAYARHAADSGAAVVVNDVDGDEAEAVAREIEASGARAVASSHSVADPGQAGALIELCATEFGGIDGLVNNAGLRHQAPIWDDEPDRMRALIEVNVLGTLYCGMAAARPMCSGQGGAIVNIASFSMLGERGATTYSASKGAVASITAGWAAELAEHGVRVNGVCPLAWTRMARADPNTACTEQHHPERIAPLVTYLLSDRARGVTGQLVRFLGDKLHIVAQPTGKQPVLERDEWDVDDIADAFDNEFAHALEVPPAHRRSTASAQ